MCELAKVSRAGFYRSLQEQRPEEEDTEVRSLRNRENPRSTLSSLRDPLIGKNRSDRPLTAALYFRASRVTSRCECRKSILTNCAATG